MLLMRRKRRPTGGLLIGWQDVVAIVSKPLISFGYGATVPKPSLVKIQVQFIKPVQWLG